MITLPAKDPAERKLVSFVFDADLAEGASIASATVSIATRAGVDASPAAVLSGAPIISGGAVMHLVRDGIAGTDYDLRCLATDSTGQVHLITAALPVKTL